MYDNVQAHMRSNLSVLLVVCIILSLFGIGNVSLDFLDGIQLASACENNIRLYIYKKRMIQQLYTIFIPYHIRTTMRNEINHILVC